MPQIEVKNRAYSTLEIKASSEEGGVRKFTGVATTPTTDRMGDVVRPEGAKFKLPIPLLWQHDSRQPVGWVKAARVTPEGIEVDCELAQIPDGDVEAVSLKQRLDEAWKSLKMKLVRGLSIGFAPTKWADIKGTWGLEYLEWDWLELSCVTIPANPDGKINAVKNMDIRTADRRERAALGRNAPGGGNQPGASGSQHAASRGTSTNQGNSTMKTLAELRARLKEISARILEIKELRDTEKREYTEEEVSERQDLQMESRRVAEDIEDLELATRAGNAVDGSTSERSAASRTAKNNPVVRKTDADPKFKGQMLVRQVIAKAIAHIHHCSIADVAEARWGKSCPQLVQIIKAGVPGGSTDTWGAELADVNTRYTGDFLDYLYNMTVFDRLPLRAVPARVRVKGQDGQATSYWVGESKPIPATSLDFSATDLNPLKVAALTVVSNELIEDSSPEAEAIIRDALAEASAQRVDTTFLSATAASAGVSPAGILNGLSALNSTGTDGAAVRNNIKLLYNGFLSDKNARNIWHIMSPAQAKAIGLIVNALGQTEFEGIGADGGNLLGDRVLTGDNVGGNDWIALKPDDIWKIGDSGIRFDISTEATIEQDTAPTGATDTPVAATASLTNMFQEESTAIKVVRRINFGKRRSGAVAYITDADFSGVAS